MYLQVCFPARAGLNHLVGNFGWHCWLAVVEHELMRQALWRVRASAKGDQALAYAEQIHPHPDITSRSRYMAERSA